MNYVPGMPPKQRPAAPADPFLRATEPLHPVLRVHCYRMLGSVSDVDEVMQEVLLRAWRGRDALADPARLRPWLYRIATNACLDALAHRPPRVLGGSGGLPPGDPTSPLGDPSAEATFLEPMPTAWLDAADAADAALAPYAPHAFGAADRDPAAALARKESVTLAFMAALHTLTPLQRATLLLRDVVGLDAAETAEALGSSVPSVNSALVRARTAIAEAKSNAPPATGEVDHALLARYLRAWESSDVDAIVATLRDDVRTTMPPRPLWIDGLAANAVFYRRMFAAPPYARRPRIIATSANAAPAFAFYRRPLPAPDAPERGPFALVAIQVLALRDGGVARIDHFMTPAAFAAFALPLTLEDRGEDA